MGTTASLQKDDNTQNGKNSKGLTARTVRQRLHNEYYDVDGILQANQEETNEIGIKNVPSVIRAKNAFLKGIYRDSHRGSGDGTNVIRKQVCVLKDLFQ